MQYDSDALRGCSNRFRRGGEPWEGHATVPRQNCYPLFASSPYKSEFLASRLTLTFFIDRFSTFHLRIGPYWLESSCRSTK